MAAWAVGDLVYLRARIVQGPHPDGGFWCRLVDEAGEASNAKRHPASNCHELPILALAGNIVPGELEGLTLSAGAVGVVERASLRPDLWTGAELERSA